MDLLHARNGPRSIPRRILTDPVPSPIGEPLSPGNGGLSPSSRHSTGMDDTLQSIIRTRYKDLRALSTTNPPPTSGARRGRLGDLVVGNGPIIEGTMESC